MTQQDHSKAHRRAARLADITKLLVFFEGGGGCYSYSTCAPGSTWFDPVVDSSDSPGRMRGIFDLADQRNPFRDWSAVVIPSCTGDVFIGSTDHTYRQGRRRILIRHRGWYNGEAALHWAFAHVRSPKRVLVAGSSAGSVGSAFHAPEVPSNGRRATHGRSSVMASASSQRIRSSVTSRTNVAQALA